MDLDKTNKFEEEAKDNDVDVQSLRGNPEERFAPAKYNDLWASVLFIIQFFALALIAFGGLSIGIFNKLTDDNDTTYYYQYNSTRDSINPALEGIPLKYSITITISVVVCGLTGAGFGALWLWLLKKFPKQMILAGFVCSAVFVTMTAIVTILVGVYYLKFILIGIGVCLLLFNFLFVVMFYIWRKRIEFSAQLLTAVVGILNDFKGTYMISALGIVAYVVWFFFWILFVLMIQQYVYLDVYISLTLLLFALFSWFWTCQVIKNVVHTTITGTVAMWYFRDEENMGDQVVMNSLKRSLTTSFGSICLGSLLVAILTTIRVVANAFARSRSSNAFVKIIALIVVYIIRVFESLLNYFNRYAFSLISIYGIPYFTAGKKAFQLFVHFGFDAVMNDSLIGSALGMGCFIGAMISALVALSISIFFELIDLADVSAVALSFILGFLTGYGIVLICLETVNSAVVGLFVCSCEEPLRLKHKIPTLWDLLSDRYATTCFNFFMNV